MRWKELEGGTYLISTISMATEKLIGFEKKDKKKQLVYISCSIMS